MPTADDIDRLRLVRTEGVGPIAYRRLLNRYRSPSAALAGPYLISRGPAGAPRRRKSPPSPTPPPNSPAPAKLGGRLIFTGDNDYPPCWLSWMTRRR